MNRDQARDEARGRIEEYLSQRGINTRKQFPCLNPQHADKHPSMSFDRKHNRVKCFSCGASYDVFDLIGMDYNLTDNKAIFEKAYELFSIQVDNSQPIRPKGDTSSMSGQNQDKSGQDTHTHTHTHTDVYTHNENQEKDFTEYYKQCMSRIDQTEYHRGLSAETLERHWIGYDPAFKTRDAETGEFVTWQALIIPTGKSSYTVRNTDPNATKKNRYRNRGSAHIFNTRALQTATRPIVIVEGEIDCMSVEEAGGESIGLGSLDNTQQLLQILKSKKPSQPLIIALDEETNESTRGVVEASEKQLIEELEKLQIPHYRLRPFAGYHDANEALTQDRAAFAEAIAQAENIEKQAEEEEREAYLGSTAGAHLQSFINGIGESVNTPCISTGFNLLDQVLDGGLYEGLITIGAISSLGKTSLTMQLCDQVAQAGTDVLVFSLEMARAELMSKSISRHTLEIALRDGIDTRNAKTARGITDGRRYNNYSRTEKQLIQDAISSYGEYANRVYIQEGVGDIGAAQIRETVEKHIRYTGRRPLLIIDYLQLLAPYNDRATDKQNTDKAVLELKRISRDCKIPVIAISSLNRQGYKEAVTMEAFKESGAIEYSSDILIGLQLKGAGTKDFNPTAEKKRNPRQIELVILKNRQGKVGDKILYEFYSMFNYFKEQELT